MTRLYSLFAYLRYWLYAMDEYSLHSPFLFEFYNEVIKRDASEGFEILEQLRDRLLDDHEMLAVQDLGAGSRVTSSRTRSVRKIVRNSGTPPRFSRLLYRLIQKYRCRTILELGTSLGLNTLYMSKASPEGEVVTFEGDPAIALRAKKNFQQQGAKNIRLIEGNIDTTLEPALQSVDSVDLAYLDANHRYEPTLRYYELIRPKLNSRSFLIIDDIHWSKAMNEAWNALIVRPEITVSVDLFEAGILLFNKSLSKAHYILAY